METNITRYKKCMKCDDIQGYIMRAKNVNSGLADADIYGIISNSVKDPYISEYCGCCKMYTLQMHVGWDYLENSKRETKDD